MKDPEKLEELIAIYAIGALEGEELEEVEKLLASGDSHARELLEKYENVASHIAYSSKGRMPDADLRKAVLKEIIGSKKYPIAEAKPPFWKRFQLIGFSLGGAVAAVLIMLLFPSDHSLNQQLADQQEIIDSLKTTIAERNSEIGELKNHYARLDELTEFLQEPGVHIIQLTNMHTDEDAGVGVLIDAKDNEALFYCLDLDHPPEGKTYQWWVKADGIHKSIAVFKVDPSGSHLVKLESVSDLGSIEEYSVTLEPDGGVDVPTGKMLFAGDHRGTNL